MKKYHGKKAILASEIGLFVSSLFYLLDVLSASVKVILDAFFASSQKDGAKNVFCYHLIPKGSLSKVAYKSCE